MFGGFRSDILILPPDKFRPDIKQKKVFGTSFWISVNINIPFYSLNIIIFFGVSLNFKAEKRQKQNHCSALCKHFFFINVSSFVLKYQANS